MLSAGVGSCAGESSDATTIVSPISLDRDDSDLVGGERFCVDSIVEGAGVAEGAGAGAEASAARKLSSDCRSGIVSECET